ncbi:MAG: hypothetical protein GF355_00735, partial [Candidatus Eisenbacteria bacterium]|nr:hypothetical protein [Candidatus Eisenbacteria bacterium]
ALVAQDQVEIAALSLRQAEERRQEIAARVERGVSPRFDLLRARVEVATRKPVLTRARNEAALAMEALRRAMGMPLDRPIALRDSLAYRPQPFTREQVVAVALEEHPQLAAARRELRAARFQLKAQAANDLPLVYLDGNYTWQGQTSDGFIPGDKESAQSATLGLSLVWPLLDGFENRYRTRQADAAVETARLTVQQLEESIRLEARRVWADVISTAEEIRAVEESVELAHEAYAIAEVRFRSGLSTQIEVLDAELALHRMRLELAGALYRYEVAEAELERVLGRGAELEPGRGEE